MHRPAGGGEVVQHAPVEVFQRMAGVHDQQEANQRAALAQIAAQELHPVGAHGFRHFGVAITGQVHQKAFVAQVKKIDVLGAAGGFRDISQPGAVGQGVDGAGFAGVGAADKGHFGAGVRQVAQVIDGSEKSGVLKQRHGILSGRRGAPDGKGDIVCAQGRQGQRFFCPPGPCHQANWPWPLRIFTKTLLGPVVTANPFGIE